MNDPSPIRVASPLYEEDVYGWAMAQAALLRESRPRRVDWENIAEELEDVGKSQYDALESALRLLLLHMLKWDHQPAFRSRSWLLTIREQHRQFGRRLSRNPGLRSSLDEMRIEAYQQARITAQNETGLDLDVFPLDPPGWNAINNPVAHEEDLPVR